MRKYYYIVDGGGGGTPAPLTAQQRTDWNGFLDYVGQQKNVDFANPKTGQLLLSQYKKDNPTFSITPDQIGQIQAEQAAFRKGDTFGSLDANALKYLRSGLGEAYLGRPLATTPGVLDANTAKLYYPQINRNGVNWGTNIEGYYNSVLHPGAKVGGPIPQGAIPRPNYADSASRLNFAQAWQKKYGVEPGYGDIPLRVNEIPYKETDTAKNLATNAAKLTGIDPALLYSSAMAEGMSGTFVNDKGQVQYSDDPQFPAQGSANFGLDNFVDRVPELIKKGYLPADFEGKYKKYVPQDPNVTQNSALYKSIGDALQAKAAILKTNYDEVDDIAKKGGISLSPEARDFFSMVSYNAGEGTAAKMIKDYQKNGYLKDDAFLKKRPTSGEGLSDASYKQVYKNIILRMKQRAALKQEGLF